MILRRDSPTATPTHTLGNARQNDNARGFPLAGVLLAEHVGRKRDGLV